MREICLLETPLQLQALGQPLRLGVLKRLAQPATCGEVAAALGESAAKVHYHLKALEAAGLVDRVDEHRVRGVMEGIYQAAARSYWLSPALIGQPGARRRVRERISLGFLVTLAESMQSDLARLAEHAADVPSLALALDVELDEAQRTGFLREVRETVQALAEKHGRRRSARGIRVRLALACYPEPGHLPLPATPGDEPT